MAGPDPGTPTEPTVSASGSGVFFAQTATQLTHRTGAVTTVFPRLLGETDAITSTGPGFLLSFRLIAVRHDGSQIGAIAASTARREVLGDGELLTYPGADSSRSPGLSIVGPRPQPPAEVTDLVD